MKNFIYFIVVIAVGLLGYWFGSNRNSISPPSSIVQYSDSANIKGLIPLDRARIIHGDYRKFSKAKLSLEQDSILSSPLIIDSARRDLSEIFAQPNFKDLIAYPGIQLDSKRKPFFTIILVGIDKSGNLITRQGRPTPARTPGNTPVILSDDIIQDDNRPCRPCPGL